MAVTIPASGYMENSLRNKGEMKDSFELIRDAIDTIDASVDQNISDISQLQIDVAALSGIASATETSEGIIELANISEVQTGTDTTRAITSAGLSSRTATETRTGIAELATNTEVQTGTDTSRIITPAGLSSRTATETRTGIIELATNTEVLTGTDTSRAVTPAGLQSKINSFVDDWNDLTFTFNSDYETNSTTLPQFQYRITNTGTAIELVGRVYCNSATPGLLVGYFNSWSTQSTMTAGDNIEFMIMQYYSGTYSSKNAQLTYVSSSEIRLIIVGDPYANYIFNNIISIDLDSY